MSKNGKNTDGCISFHIKINMDNQDVVNIKDEIKIPYLIDKAHLPHAEANFENIFKSMIVNPVSTRVSNKIRDLLEEDLKNLREEKEKVETNTPKDIFLESKQDDTQEKSNSSDSGKKRKQGNKGQESEEGEWEVPDPISG